MGALDILRAMGGCEGGRHIYYAAKALAMAANISRRNRKLFASTRRKLKPLFPDLNLKRVRLNINASLPANWFRDGDDAMTFGFKIIFKGSNIQNRRATNESMALLVHELVHVDQMREMGEWNFACEYGRGFLDTLDYEKIPLEVEAINMQEAYLEGKAQPIVRNPIYIANRRPDHMELHEISCYWVTQMNPDNKLVYHSIQEGLDDGFDGCWYCLRGHHTH